MFGQYSGALWDIFSAPSVLSVHCVVSRIGIIGVWLCSRTCRDELQCRIQYSVFRNFEHIFNGHSHTSSCLPSLLLSPLLSVSVWVWWVLSCDQCIYVICSASAGLCGETRPVPNMNMFNSYLIFISSSKPRDVHHGHGAAGTWNIFITGSIRILCGVENTTCTYLPVFLLLYDGLIELTW